MRSLNWSNYVVLWNAPQNETYTDIGGVQDKFGHTLSVCVLYMTFVMPLSALGVALNLLSFAVLNTSEDEFKLSLFAYWRVETLVGAVANTIECLNAVSNGGKRFIYGVNTLAWTIFIVQPGAYLQTTLFMFRAYLDLLLLVDRIAMLNPVWRQRFSLLLRLPPYVNSLLLFVVCAALSVPAPLLNSAKAFKLSLFGEANTAYYYVPFQSALSRTQYGQGLGYLDTVLANFLPLVLELLLNVLSLRLFHGYMNKKKSIAMNGASRGALSTQHHMLAAGNGVLQMTEKSVNNNNSNNNNNKMGQGAPPPTDRQHTSSHSQLDAAEKKLFLMVLVLSSVSVVQQSISISYFIFQLVAELSFGYQFFIDLSICVKHFLNFFILFFFNKNFKKALSKYFTCSFKSQ
jgi:hypothetical protein